MCIVKNDHTLDPHHNPLARLMKPVCCLALYPAEAQLPSGVNPHDDARLSGASSLTAKRACVKVWRHFFLMKQPLAES
jgi:hypothetical protein